MPEKQGPAALAGANRAGNRVVGQPLDTMIVPRAPAAMSEPKRSIAAVEANLRPTGLGARIRALCARRIEPVALTQSTQRRQVDEAVP
jgi:hypothetical protein